MIGYHLFCLFFYEPVANLLTVKRQNQPLFLNSPSITTGTISITATVI